MRPRSWSVLSGSLLSLVLMSGCGGAAAPAGPSSTASATAKPAESGAPGSQAAAASPGGKPITIAWTSIVTSFAPYWFAYEKGFYAKRGVNVKLQSTTPAVGAQALAARDVEVASTPEIPLLRAQNVDVKYFGGIIHYIANAYFGRKGLKPELTAANLEGKTVSASSPNAPTDIYGREVLLRHGIDPAKLKFIYTQSVPATVAGLSSGQFDLAAIAPPYAFTLTKDPDIVILSPLLAERVPYAVSWPAAQTEWLKTHETEAKAILLALRDGIEWAKANPEEAQQIQAKYVKEDNKESIRQSYELDMTRYGGASTLSANDTEALTMVLKYATQADPKVSSIKVEDLIYENDKIFKSLG